jgi:hypothetical protein
VSISAILPVNLNVTPINIGIAVVVTGAATYNVEHTYDDPYSAVSPVTWFNNPTLAAAQIATKDTYYTTPIRAIRINQTAGAGSTLATVIQAGLQ